MDQSFLLWRATIRCVLVETGLARLCTLGGNFQPRARGGYRDSARQTPYECLLGFVYNSTNAHSLGSCFIKRDSTRFAMFCLPSKVPLDPDTASNVVADTSGSSAPPALFQAEGWEGDAAVSDWGPFRLLGRSMIDYVADYYEGVESRAVRASVEPGYLKVQ